MILACRNYDRAVKARRLIIEKTDNTNIYVKLIDLGSFESVKGFTRDINQNEDRLDILVNNAAVAQTDQRKSKDGYHLGMQVNYFSLFVLTNLLLGECTFFFLPFITLNFFLRTDAKNWFCSNC